jgi:hypothetical protein
MELNNMTNEEKIAKGLCTAYTDAVTGETTIIPFTDEEIANIKEPVITQPTIEELKAQLADLQAKLNSL